MNRPMVVVGAVGALATISPIAAAIWTSDLGLSGKLGVTGVVAFFAAIIAMAITDEITKEVD